MSSLRLSAATATRPRLGCSSRPWSRHCGLERGNVRPMKSFFSSSSSVQVPMILGGHAWTRMGPPLYQEVVRTALEHGITNLEAGQEGGDAALAQVLTQLHTTSPALWPKHDETPLTVFTRVGYRTLMPQQIIQQDSQPPSPLATLQPDDVLVEQIPLPQAPNATATSDHQAPNEDDNDHYTQVVHNLTTSILQKYLDESPFHTLVQQNALRMVYMIHNPEVQVMHITDPDEKPKRLLERLVQAFERLEQAKQNQELFTYGVVSNGFGLPPEHPLYLDPQLVLQAKQEAGSTPPPDTAKFMIQFPANLLETDALNVATTSFAQEPNVELIAMRPLTCYPDRGTGTGHPLRLVDYQLPFSAVDDHNRLDADSAQTMQSTHLMKEPPLAYQLALKAALSHFDAEHLLEIKAERDLTVEERETLDGCKLLQSMIHDLDHGLQTVSSLAAHEEELMTHIIPLIRDTFEEYDEETGRVMQAFFATYSLAVRQAIAQRTRAMLRGDDHTAATADSPTPTYPDISEDMTLQEYALRFLLQQLKTATEQSGNSFQIAVGCSQPEQVVENVKLIETSLLANTEEPTTPQDN